MIAPRRPSSPPRAAALVAVGALAFVPVAAGAQAGGPGGAAPAFVQATALEAVLPQSSVYDVLEDREGFLWFATREGVARWDGREVRTWRHDPFDDGSVPGNVVWTLDQDARGDVWITTYDYLQVPVGLARLRAPTFTAVDRFGLPGAAVALTAEGEPVAVTADSLWRFDGDTETFRPWKPRAPRPDGRPLRGPPPHTLTTPDGWLWIADGSGLERCPLSGAAAEPCQVPGGLGAGLDGPLLLAHDGAVWVGGADGVVRFDGASSPENGPTETLALGAPPADLAQDTTGVIWVLSEAGVDRIDGLRVVDRSPLPVVGTRTTLAPVTVHVDGAQNVWVGTVWGVFVHERGRKAFHHLEHDPDDADSPGSGLVAALAEEPGGAIWMGTIGGGLNRWDRRSGRVDRYRHDPTDPSSLVDDVVWDLAFDDSGTLWIATSRGLARHRPGSGRFEAFPRAAADVARGDPEINSIPDLQFDPTGRLWTTCSRGCPDTLWSFDPATGRFDGLEAAPLRRAGYLGMDPRGTLWIGTADGIDRIDPVSGRHDPVPGSGGLDGVLAFHFSSGGEVWVGANSGLYRLGEDGTPIDRLTTADGLPSNAVYGILEDDRRRMWLSTNRGLALVDLDEPVGRRVRTYDGTTGLRNVEFNRNAYLEAADGTLFFGGDRGLTWFDPAEIRDNPYTPPVVVTALERATDEGSTRVPLGPDPTIRLRPADETFTLEFAALSYVNPHRNRYRTLLEGFDEGWRDVGTAARATYTNVPPGRYTFRVQGANEDGLWSPVEGRADVVVEPWPWETLWFRLVAVVLLAAAVAAVAVFRSRSRYRAELARIRADRALERERARLSRDMHDEVGASLTEIAILSDVALSHAGADAPVTERLKRIGGTSRGALDAIGGIIWAIDPANDGQRVGAYLREYAADVLEGAGLRAHLDFPPSHEVPDVSAEARRTLLLVLKEALANVIRHAEAAAVSVRFAVHEGFLALTVSDDGRGLPTTGAPGPDAGHDGLRNMRHRAEAAGGTLTIARGEGGGTVLALRIPVGESRA